MPDNLDFVGRVGRRSTDKMLEDVAKEHEQVCPLLEPINRLHEKVLGGMMVLTGTRAATLVFGLCLLLTSGKPLPKFHFAQQQSNTSSDLGVTNSLQIAVTTQKLTDLDEQVVELKRKVESQQIEIQAQKDSDSLTRSITTIIGSIMSLFSGLSLILQVRGRKVVVEPNHQRQHTTHG